MANGTGFQQSGRNSEAERRGKFVYGEDFSLDRFLSDESYRNSLQARANINLLPGTKRETDEELSRLLGLSTSEQQAKGAFEKIDLAPIFDPLKGDINQITGQQLQSSKANISRQAAGAQERATEGLAGTGLGRSGVAAQQFGEVEGRRQDLLAGAEQEIEARRLQALFKVSQAQAQAEYSEELQKRGWTLKQVDDALGFDRQLFAMQFGAELQAELEGDASSLFADLVDIGTGIMQIGAGAASMFGGNPAGAAGVAGGAVRIGGVRSHG
jgi:hypothetical protein